MAFCNNDPLTGAQKKMAKHPTSREEIPSYVVSAISEPTVERRLPIGAIVLSVLLAVYILVSYLLLGPSQHVLLQRLLGGGCACWHL